MNSFKKIIIGAAMVLSGISPAWALNLDNLRSYFLNGNYQACISEGEKILARSVSAKDLDELYYILGLSYLKQNNHLRASDIFEIIIKEYRGSGFKDEARLGLADSFFLKGDFSKAQDLYQELLKNNSRSKLKPAIYYRLSQLARKTSDRQKEKEYLDKLKSEFPQSPEALSDKEFLPLAKMNYSPGIHPAPSVNLKPEIRENNFVPAQPVKTEVKENDLVLAPSAKANSPVPARESGPEGKTSASEQELISGSYSVQVGAFSSLENARKLTLKLQAQGLSAYISAVDSLNKKVYKVRVGGFLSRQEAMAAESRLKTRGYPTKIIP